MNKVLSVFHILHPVTQQMLTAPPQDVFSICLVTTCHPGLLWRRSYKTASQASLRPLLEATWWLSYFTQSKSQNSITCPSPTPLQPQSWNTRTLLASKPVHLLLLPPDILLYSFFCPFWSLLYTHLIREAFCGTLPQYKIIAALFCPPCFSCSIDPHENNQHLLYCVWWYICIYNPHPYAPIS